MTIPIIKTVLLWLLLGLGGFGVVAWLTAKIRLNLLQSIGFSLLIGVSLYMALVVVLLLSGGEPAFRTSDTALWVFAGLGLASAGLAIVRGRRAITRQLKPDRSQLVVLVLSLLIVAPLALHSVLYPLTSWDAKMIWMVKAKALYVQPTVPNTLFESDVFTSSHKDYPLGLPALVASHYEWYGGVSEQPVAFSYVIFFWLILLLVAGTVLSLGGRRAATSRDGTDLTDRAPPRTAPGTALAVGLLIILAAGDVFLFAGLGLADVPIALMVLGAVVSLWGAIQARSRSEQWLWLAVGAVAALSSGNLKNEGQSFIILFVLAAVVTIWMTRGSPWQKHDLANTQKKTTTTRLWWQRAALLLPIALLVLPQWLWHSVKAEQGYKVDLFIEGVNRTVQEYTDRAIEVVHWFVLEIPTVEHWGWALLPALTLAVGLAAVCLRHRQRVVLLVPLGLLAAQLAVYALIYVISPHDLWWHVTTSIDRLLIHLVPALYLSVALLYCLLLGKKPVYSTDYHDNDDQDTA